MKKETICKRCIKACALGRGLCDFEPSNPKAKEMLRKHKVSQHGISLVGEKYRCHGGHVHADPTGAEMMRVAGSPELI